MHIIVGDKIVKLTDEEWQARLDKRNRKTQKLQDKAQEIAESLDDEEKWFVKQALSDGRYYGDGGTIHSTNHIDVVTDAMGNVTEVWFRCQQLPYQQVKRIGKMFEWERKLVTDGLPRLMGVEVLDD